MPDDTVQPESIHMTQHLVFVVDRWPALTSFTAESLRQVHYMSGTYDQAAGTVTFDVFNGAATYKLLDPVPAMFGDPTEIKAELVEGSNKLTSRRP